MTQLSELHERWMRKPGYRKAHKALEDEFAIVRAVIAARKHAGITQAELARRMGTTQPAVTRLESGRVQPSLRTLRRVAEATGLKLMIEFEPLDQESLGTIASKSVELVAKDQNDAPGQVRRYAHASR